MSNGNDMAFPTPRELAPNDSTQVGLTKREYFAALALQVILAAGNTDGALWTAIASDAVHAADALLQELAARELRLKARTS